MLMSSQETCQISKKQIYAQKKENKKHIYITNKIYLNKITDSPKKLYSQKTSLIPQKSEMPKKNKNLLPKYIYSRKNLLSRKKCKTTIYHPKNVIFPKKHISKKKSYTQKKVIFPKKSYTSRNSGKMIGIENQISTRSWAQKPNHYPTKLQFSRVVIWLLGPRSGRDLVFNTYHFARIGYSSRISGTITFFWEYNFFLGI